MANKKTPTYKPGTKAPASGQYSPCSNNGKVCNTSKEITAITGVSILALLLFLIYDKSEN